MTTNNINDNNQNNKEKFWEDYSKSIKKGEKGPSLKSQVIKIYKTDTNWVHSEKFFLKNTELLKCIEDIEIGNNPPFTIIDVREESEYMIYKIPNKNKVQNL